MSHSPDPIALLVVGSGLIALSLLEERTRNLFSLLAGRIRTSIPRKRKRMSIPKTWQDIVPLLGLGSLPREDSLFQRHALELVQLYYILYGKESFRDSREQILRQLRALAFLLPIPQTSSDDPTTDPARRQSLAFGKEAGRVHF